MPVFLRCDFTSPISFVHTRATRETKNNEFMDFFFHSGAFFVSIFPFVFFLSLLHLCLLLPTVQLPTTTPGGGSDFHSAHRDHSPWTRPEGAGCVF
jgi:hypothetical protein